MTSRQVTVTGIVLQRRDWMESDRLLTLMTKEQGKLEVIARGARRSHSHLAASTEPFVLGEMHLAKGKLKNYLTQTRIQSTFPEIRKDYVRLSAAVALGELNHAFTLYHQSSPEIFNLFALTLSFLEHHPNPLVVLVWSGLKLMELEGVHPNWIHCNVKGTPVSERLAWVSPSMGGYVSDVVAQSCFDRYQVPIEVLIGLAKTSECKNPPQNLKLAKDCLRTLSVIWKELTHMSLPALENILALP